jgi:hypothetical protein
VLEHAVRPRRDHGADLTVAVDLSARVLLEPDLPEVVVGLCRAHDVPPDALVLEITESMVVADPGGLRRAAHAPAGRRAAAALRRGLGVAPSGPSGRQTPAEWGSAGRRTSPAARPGPAASTS